LSHDDVQKKSSGRAKMSLIYGFLALFVGGVVFECLRLIL